MPVRTGARPTMRHVAERAGVSLKTVSRVINEEASVAPHTAARVTEAIAELGFRRNDLARSLRRGSTSATVARWLSIRRRTCAPSTKPPPDLGFGWWTTNCNHN